MQSDGSIRFQGWNKNNLLHALSSKKSSQLGFVVLECHSTNDTDIIISLPSGGDIELKDVIWALEQDNPQATPWLLLLLCDESISIQQLFSITTLQRSHRIGAFSIWGDVEAATFAFCCEAAHFWELKSCRASKVTYLDLYYVFTNFLKSYSSIMEQFRFRNLNQPPPIFNRTAWTNGAVYTSNVDFEKFEYNARIEQRLDSIKRMMDAAATPRFQHSKTNERLISTQSFFWLLEIADVIDFDGWLANTQFFTELDPVSLSQQLNLLHLEKVNNIRVDWDEIVTNFVEIPSGDYSFGGENPNVESEPPTRPLTARLESFRIMKFPVTNKLWSSFSPTPSADNLPVTGRNFFECRAFAKLVEVELQKSGLIDACVDLPTECQWEAAARGHTDNIYPWSGPYDVVKCNAEMRLGCVSPVGAYSPQGDSWCGCQDLAGNVREWTASYGGTQGVDWRQLSPTSTNEEPTSILQSSRMIIRGGSYSYDKDCLQNWVRNTQIACRRDMQTGFRLVIKDRK